MNLSKRASLLILPVILCSYVLVAIGLYGSLKKSIFQNEKGRLESHLQQLKSQFSIYTAFTESYLISLVEGEVLGEFVNDPNHLYRKKDLTSKLETAVKRFKHNKPEFMSVSLIDRSGQVLYYSENSLDPFSTIKSEQLDFAQGLYKDKLLYSWEHKKLDSGGTVFQQAQSIDYRTLAPPLETQLEHTVQLIVATKPVQFDQLLNQLQSRYQGTATFSYQQLNIDKTQMNSCVELYKDYFLAYEANPSYLQKILLELQQWILITVLGATFITFSILQLLIKRYVVNPIGNLDEQLDSVMSGNNEDYQAPKGRDEVSRLGKKFHHLYKNLHHSYEESQRSALTDALTGLPNRTAFYQAATLQLTHMNNVENPTAFIYIDLDNFKFVNDKYGHEIGDMMLKTLATKLQHLLEVTTKELTTFSPVVSRLSGDEFVLMLPETNSEEAEKVGQQILGLFIEGYHFELGSFPVTASLGLACYPEDGHQLSQLIANADLAMYEAKKSGKNQIQRYSQALAKRARRTNEIEACLKDVDFDEEFHLVVMPIMNRDRTITSFEVLLRWSSPKLGFVGPDEFIPIVESTGLFQKVDLWVINNAHKLLEEIQQKLSNQHLSLAINISSAELDVGTFISQLKEINRRYSIPPEQIELEITETFSIENNDQIKQTLIDLREAGFSIAIDDFGAGYTSMMQMLDYPVNSIKLDKDFIDRITTPEKAAVLQPLINLCQLQDLRVTAEGIETIEQMDILLDAGCDFLQGYLIAKPMTIEQLTEWAKHEGKEFLPLPSETY